MFQVSKLVPFADGSVEIRYRYTCFHTSLIKKSLSVEINKKTFGRGCSKEKLLETNFSFILIKGNKG